MTRSLAKWISVMVFSLTVVLYSLILVSCCAAPSQNAMVNGQKNKENKKPKTGIVVDVANSPGTTQLHTAADLGKLDVAEHLAASGADVNAKMQNKWTPLMLAARAGSVKMAKLLIEHGADISAVNSADATPLYIASFHGKSDIISLLIEKGADPNTVINDGSTPLMAAIRNGHAEVSKTLVAMGAGENPSLVKTDKRKISFGLPKELKSLKEHNLKICTKLAGNLRGKKFRVGSRYGRFAQFNLVDIINNDQNYTHIDKESGELYLQIATPRDGSIGRLGKSGVAGIYLNDNGAIVIHLYNNELEKATPNNERSEQPDEGKGVTKLLPPFTKEIIGPSRVYWKWINEHGEPIYDKHINKDRKYGTKIGIIEYQFVGFRGKIAQFRAPLNEIRVRNPNNFDVAAGVRSGRRGKDVHIPAGGMGSIWAPDGEYEIFFVYSNNPNTLFQGDNFTLKGKGVEIRIVKVVDGNYGIRRVK